jgi:hypothetical protein
MKHLELDHTNQLAEILGVLDRAKEVLQNEEINLESDMEASRSVLFTVDAHSPLHHPFPSDWMPARAGPTSQEVTRRPHHLLTLIRMILSTPFKKGVITITMLNLEVAGSTTARPQAISVKNAIYYFY